MRVPQVSERIKEAPAQALRGVFAGIGQLLLITDRLRHKAPEHQDAPARTPGTPRAITDAPVTSPAGSPRETTAGPAAAEQAGAPSVAEAGVAPATEAAPEAAPAKPAARSTAPRRQSTRNFDKTGNVRLLADEADSAAAAEPVAVTAAPLPNYDALTVASLRARLRSLDIAQVRQLAEYERAHAGRADVLGMYERRIAKLEAEA